MSLVEQESPETEEEFFLKTKEEMMIEFQKEIESKKVEGITYIELIAEYCEQRDIEVESIKELISPNFRAKIYKESAQLRLIKSKTQTLS